MPYFNDMRQAAGFLANFGFVLSDPVTSDTMDRYEYTLHYGSDSFDGTITLSHGAPAPTVLTVLPGLVKDALDAERGNIDAFAEERRLIKPSEVVSAWEDCKAADTFLRDKLLCSYGELTSMQTFFEENKDTLPAALESEQAGRRAAYEKTHPAIPEGFVTLDDLQEDLDLGELGDQCHGYCSDDIGETFYNIVDDWTDTQYSELMAWLPDHTEWLEKAWDENRLAGCDGDIYKMIQAAQFECFYDDLYTHRADIVVYDALTSLKELGVYAVKQSVADEIMALNGAAYSRFSDCLDDAQAVIDAELERALGDALHDPGLGYDAMEAVKDAYYEKVNPVALSVEAAESVNKEGYDAAFAAFAKEVEARGAAVSLSDAANECRASSQALGANERVQAPGLDSPAH